MLKCLLNGFLLPLMYTNSGVLSSSATATTPKTALENFGACARYIKTCIKNLDDTKLKKLKKGKKQYRFVNVMAPPKGLEPLTY